MTEPNRGDIYRHWRASFGDASLASLLAQLGPGRAADLERAHRALHTPARLEAERVEDLRRAAAATGDDALVAYERHWAKRLRRLQRAHPARWRIAGLSAEEVVDVLTLHLIEGVRDGAAMALQGRPGREWGLLRAEAHVRTLRRTFRLDATPVDLRAAPIVARTLDPEALWVEAEAERSLGAARSAAERALASNQRAWLDALRATVTEGEVFAASGKPNLTAASRRVGMNRSSALRAYRNLQQIFTAALRNVE